MNQIVLVGKVKELPQIKETANGTKVATLIVSVERNFKNSSGEMESDDFQITLWRGVAEECSANCKLGSVVGVKGRIQANNFKKEDATYYKNDIIAEKLSFLNNVS